ncbi:MAG: hypothetical protein AAF518_10200 [Spirochaetota bacterium]
MENNRFNYYYLEYKTYFLDVFCLFDSLQPKIERETEAIFSMFVLALKTNIRIHLDRPKFLETHFIDLILKLGRDLRESNRSLIVVGAPESFKRYLKKFEMDKMILLQEEN